MTSSSIHNEARRQITHTEKKRSRAWYSRTGYPSRSRTSLGPNDSSHSAGMPFAVEQRPWIRGNSTAEEDASVVG